MSIARSAIEHAAQGGRQPGPGRGRAGDTDGQRQRRGQRERGADDGDRQRFPQGGQKDDSSVKSGGHRRRANRQAREPAPEVDGQNLASGMLTASTTTSRTRAQKPRGLDVQLGLAPPFGPQ